MTISQAESYTMMLLKQHLPKDFKNWKVEFFYTSRYAGKCDMNRKVITISLLSMELLSHNQMQEVCQHEAAHAIAFVKFKCTNHNHIWEAVCKNVVKCPANRILYTDKEFKKAYSEEYIALIADQVKIEIEKFLLSDSKFFLGNNIKFLTEAYGKYRSQFLDTKMNSIDIFEKVLYYHLLMKTNASDVIELNQILSQPQILNFTEVHNTLKLLISHLENKSKNK